MAVRGQTTRRHRQHWGRELQRWTAQTEVKPDSIPRQLLGTVELLERVGFAAEAGKWKAELQERKPIR